MKTLWQTLIRLGFRLLYYELAWIYDLVSWLVSLGEWRGWQQAALPFVNGRFILEIGHGPGHLLLELSQTGKQVVGLDLSPHMGRLARRRLRRAGVVALLVRGNVQVLPLQTAVFDTVLSTFPTDYVVHPETLAAVFRVLGENGRFVIVPEGHLTGTGLLHRFIHWLFWITGQRSGPFALDENHTWPDAVIWEPFRRRFAAAGFTVAVHHVQRPRSGVTVIVAEKTNIES
ncbi:MAG: methyltransferase domain-containing protein [Anaerolineales bacterium]|nr:methyltransferase domain-containing protein [Anaerolineales bacterium]